MNRSNQALTEAELTTRFVFMCSLLGIYVLFVVVTTAALVYRHICKDEMLAKRSIPLVIVQAVAGTILGAASLTATSLRQYPCTLRLWIISLGVLMWLLAVTMRGIQHLLLGWMNRAQTTAQHVILPCASSSNQMADRTLAMSYKNFCGESLRPETAQTLDLWSELTIQQSQDSLTCPEDPSEVVHTPLRRLVRVKPLLLLLGLASALLTVYPAVVSAKSATYSVYGPASRLACSDDFGWEMWFPYGTAALFIGPVFLALQVAMCLSRNIYSTRTDITICMLVSQMALVLYTIWVAVLRQERVHLSEFFIIWLAMLATHISSVCWPLWCSIKRYSWMSIRPPPNGFGNPYGGTRPRRSLYTSLYQEFQMTLEDKAKRERFLQYATHCYRSELPSFLHDYQLLKYQVIDALRENQIHAHTPDPTVDAYLDKSRSKIQTVKEHPLADLIPITRGILESAMLLLPPLVVDESTQFPEAVKSSFSNFICTYLSSSSHMFISIPGEAVAEIHSAVEESYVPLSILDRAKDEVLFLLCTDVFSSYRKWLEAH